ncbi:hypothetical protein PR202_gb23005 [Eleusine coracana subsp. coracana]|uniref:Uncharacterized protein n=1 Tax=Eleusine coracana subsp. coracana TaxID=191504 RepID=A0AAV5FHK2_ELECO|nr:hypothetical protein PR202_gb23005 [Eleusine coracana subsp. coracana]
MDYGGTMPQLQENLCSLLHHARQESSILKPLKVMVIKDMIYLIHVNGLAEHASPNAGSQSQHQLAFVDLEKSCCKVLTSSNHPFSMFCMVDASSFTLLKVVLVQLLSNTEENDNVMDLVSVQDLFSSKFPVDISINLPVLRPGIPKQKSEFSERTTNVDLSDEGILLIDLSSYLNTTQVALPSLNG